MIALLYLSGLGFLFVVFHDKAKRTQQGNLLVPCPPLLWTNFVGNEHDERRGHESLKKSNTFVYSAFGCVISISTLSLFEYRIIRSPLFLAARNPGYPDFGRSCMPNYGD